MSKSNKVKSGDVFGVLDETTGHVLAVHTDTRRVVARGQVACGNLTTITRPGLNELARFALKLTQKGDVIDSEPPTPPVFVKEDVALLQEILDDANSVHPFVLSEIELHRLISIRDRLAAWALL